MIIKNEAQRETVLAAGKRLRKVLDAVAERVSPGALPKDLDAYARGMITESGDIPAFLHYKPAGSEKGFPGTLCVSVNDEIVHGVPANHGELKDGDIVSIDAGLEHNGVFVDAAYTTIVGSGDSGARNLVEATRKALCYALVFVHDGMKTGEVGSAIEMVAMEYGFTAPPELGGHGVGAAPHEEPFIPNIGNPGMGDTLRDGQVVALEPIFIEGSDPRIKLSDDGFTYLTADGTRSAHFEHTVIITKSAPVIVTGPMW